MAFLVFEGIDGSGKTTLIKSVTHELKQRGIAPVLTKEPGGTAFGSSIREILLRKENPPTPLSELLLYYADRRQNIEQRIKPALLQKKWIISDRYWASTYAFQCAGRKVDIAFMETLRNFVCKGFEPDFWILLDLPVEVSLQRLETSRKNTRDRFELEEKKFHKKVRQAYLDLASREKDKWLVLDARKSLETLVADVILKLEDKKLLKEV